MLNLICKINFTQVQSSTYNGGHGAFNLKYFAFANVNPAMSPPAGYRNLYVLKM